MAPDHPTELVAKIYNAAWPVRVAYSRGGRWSKNSTLALQRAEAIRQLGLVVRDCFNKSDDFEALLTAVYDGLSPKDVPPF